MAQWSTLRGHVRLSCGILATKIVVHPHSTINILDSLVDSKSTGGRFMAALSKVVAWLRMWSMLDLLLSLFCFLGGWWQAMVFFQATDYWGSLTNHLHDKNMGLYKKLSHLTSTFLNGALTLYISIKKWNWDVDVIKIYGIYFTLRILILERLHPYAFNLEYGCYNLEKWRKFSYEPSKIIVVLLGEGGN